MARLRILWVCAFLIGAACFGWSQCGDTDAIAAFYPDLQIQVKDLPEPRAPSPRASAALSAALETVFRDPAMCCAKGSALEDVALAENLSLKELGGKLQGKHRLNDGRSIVVNARYVAQGAITPEVILGALREQRALLMEWKSRLYVLYGAVFNETVFICSGKRHAITKLLLLDPRQSGPRRETEFDRAHDDMGKIQGILTLEVSRP